MFERTCGFKSRLGHSPSPICEQFCTCGVQRCSQIGQELGAVVVGVVSDGCVVGVEPPSPESAGGVVVDVDEERSRVVRPLPW